MQSRQVQSNILSKQLTRHTRPIRPDQIPSSSLAICNLKQTPRKERKRTSPQNPSKRPKKDKTHPKTPKWTKDPKENKLQKTQPLHPFLLSPLASQAHAQHGLVGSALFWPWTWTSKRPVAWAKWASRRPQGSPLCGFVALADNARKVEWDEWFEWLLFLGLFLLVVLLLF